VPNSLMEPGLIRGAADLRTVEDALAHWQLVQTAEAGRGEQWISVAFEIARRERRRGGRA
jgi:hypothetical protein